MSELADVTVDFDKNLRLNHLEAKAVLSTNTRTIEVLELGNDFKLGELSGKRDGFGVTCESLVGGSSGASARNQGALENLEASHFTNKTSLQSALRGAGIQSIQGRFLDQVLNHMGVQQEPTAFHRGVVNAKEALSLSNRLNGATRGVPGSKGVVGDGVASRAVNGTEDGIFNLEAEAVGNFINHFRLDVDIHLVHVDGIDLHSSVEGIVDGKGLASVNQVLPLDLTVNGRGGDVNVRALTDDHLIALAKDFALPVLVADLVANRSGIELSQHLLAVDCRDKRPRGEI